jgi:hypothetical protein
VTSFESLETSVEGSVPIEVYRFVIGGETFLYTSTEDELTIGTDVYQPTPIDRSTFSQGPDDRAQLVTFTLPQLNEFVVRYLSVAPGAPATVTVIQLQRNEVPTFDTQIVRFQGRVRSVRYTDDDLAEVGVQSQEYALSRTIPTRVYSMQCNLMLYSPDCGASTVGHSLLSATVTAVSGNTITVAGVAASGLDFVSCYVKPNGQDDLRTIYGQSGDVLTLLLPFASSPLGSTVDVFEGCDHLQDGDCQTKFGRGIDNGGFFFVPLKDIFQNGLT